MQLGLLTGVWIPPHKVRDLRSLIARREKMVRLSTMAKNRLHALLHRKHLVLSRGNPFHRNIGLVGKACRSLRPNSSWSIPILDTLDFAQRQIEQVEEQIKQESARDDRIPLLVQLPGVAMLTAITILAAIGDISRFEPPKSWWGMPDWEPESTIAA